MKLPASFLLIFLLLVLSAGNALSESDFKSEIWHTKAGEIDFYCIQDAPLEIANDSLLTEDKNLLSHLAPHGKSPSSFGLFVIKKGTETVLVDTGVGGKLIEHLQSIGIKPEDIKNILLTHSHGDHVGGLLKDEKKNFPNAVIWLDARELEFWKSAKNKELCEQCLKQYGEPKILLPDEKTATIFPEIVAIDLAGHTPGHTGFLIVSGKTKIFLAGDLLHSSAVQFFRPDIGFQYDNNPEQAAEIRRKILKRAADENWLFAASHLPFPCAGYVKTDGNGFQLLPASVKSFYEFSVKDIDGNDFSLEKLKGKKVMVVNVASKCGLTPQYKELQELFTKYGDKNFTIIAFPANNFKEQEPGTNREIKTFCTKNYGVTFQMMSKISVKGDDIHPLYQWLTEKKNNGVMDAPVEWNFQKFLIDEEGNWVYVIPPREKPNSEKVLKWLEQP